MLSKSDEAARNVAVEAREEGAQTVTQAVVVAVDVEDEE